MRWWLIPPSLAEPPPAWASSAHLENYALTLGKVSAGDRTLVAAAAKTTKLEIKDPEAFFENVTLKSADAKKWLSSHLAASINLAPHPPPQIYMLTGLVLMTHATWTSLTTNDPRFVPGFQAPFDPSGVSVIRRLSVSDGIKPTFGFEGEDEDGKRVEGAVVHETGKYPGTRGWAARWQRVGVTILKEGAKDAGQNILKLKGARAEGKSVEVDLEEVEEVEEDEGKDDDDEEFDEEFWDKFLDKVDESV